MDEGSRTGVTVLRPAGDLDMQTVPSLRDQIFTGLARHRHVVVDLSEVRFCGSHGMQLLVDAHQRAGEQGSTLHVSGAGERHIARPLRLTGLDRTLRITARSAEVLVAELRGGAATVQPRRGVDLEISG